MVKEGSRCSTTCKRTDSGKVEEGKIKEQPTSRGADVRFLSEQLIITSLWNRLTVHSQLNCSQSWDLQKLQSLAVEMGLCETYLVRIFLLQWTVELIELHVS